MYIVINNNSVAYHSTHDTAQWSHPCGSSRKVGTLHWPPSFHGGVAEILTHARMHGDLLDVQTFGSWSCIFSQNGSFVCWHPRDDLSLLRSTSQWHLICWSGFLTGEKDWSTWSHKIPLVPRLFSFPFSPPHASCYFSDFRLLHILFISIQPWCGLSLHSFLRSCPLRIRLKTWIHLFQIENICILFGLATLTVFLLNTQFCTFIVLVVTKSSSTIDHCSMYFFPQPCCLQRFLSPPFLYYLRRPSLPSFIPPFSRCVPWSFLFLFFFSFDHRLS